MIFEKMQNAVESLMKKMHNLPFNQELSQGTLPNEKFIFYLVQDALYLADFSKALALTASKLSDSAQIQQLTQFSLDAINVEQALHANYLKKYGAWEQSNMKKSPACFMYTHYLLKMASLASVAEAVASLLPCFWVYREVGKNIALNQSANNPYHDWIALYSSDEFDVSVNSVITITDDLASVASDATKKKMLSAFVQSTELEWLFWDSAYRQETWLVEETNLLHN